MHHPDVVIVGVRMPPTRTDEGLRAALTIRRDHPDLPVLVFSRYVETRHLAEMLGRDSPRGTAGVG